MCRQLYLLIGVWLLLSLLFLTSPSFYWDLGHCTIIRDMNMVIPWANSTSLNKNAILMRALSSSIFNSN